MKAKGSFFVGRREYIVSTFGEERWKQFVLQLAREDPAFAAPILATTLLPMASYARFQEGCAREFFDGDDQSYWVMGAAAAAWGLTAGPYAALARDKSYVGILEKLPLAWSMYFTAGKLETAAEPDYASFKITGNALAHICVEYTVIGFGRKALEMVGKKPKTTRRLRGVTDGDGSVIHYEIWWR